MMDTTACKHCGRIGFVRETKVIQGVTSHVELYCGVCNQSWTTDDRRAEVRPLPKPRTVTIAAKR